MEAQPLASDSRCPKCAKRHSRPVVCRQCGEPVQVCEIRLGPMGPDDLYHMRPCWKVPGTKKACGPVRL